MCAVFIGRASHSPGRYSYDITPGVYCHNYLTSYLGMILTLLLLVLPVSTFGGKCGDDVYKDCKRRAERGLCHGEGGELPPAVEVAVMLAECRESCKNREKHE